MFFIDDNSPDFLGLSRKGETFVDCGRMGKMKLLGNLGNCGIVWFPVGW